MSQVSNGPTGDELDKRSEELEQAIGWAVAARVRSLRLARGLTVTELAERSGLSKAMVSKVENAQSAAGTGTLARLAIALDVPVTSFFMGLDLEADEAVYVPAGTGAEISREGTRVGHRYELIGALRAPFKAIEPVLVTMTNESEVFPLFQHPGIEMLYMLQGRLQYAYGPSSYTLSKGDTLLLRGQVAHGPSRLLRVPIQFLSIKVFVDDER
ncbi:MAG: helix-turn-helix transcriptional regulator [Acidimicrobiia bacterium]|nr:helix-turn-helix transcriptional regulator [Acidimicrobiia bacterium]